MTTTQRKTEISQKSQYRRRLRKKESRKMCNPTRPRYGAKKTLLDAPWVEKGASQALEKLMRDNRWSQKRPVPVMTVTKRGTDATTAAKVYSQYTVD
jgi:hypothetical protein